MPGIIPIKMIRVNTRRSSPLPNTLDSPSPPEAAAFGRGTSYRLQSLAGQSLKGKGISSVAKVRKLTMIWK
jgi:hypothetical protein